MISKSWTGKLDLKFLNLFLYWLWSANEIVVNLEKKNRAKRNENQIREFRACVLHEK